MKRTISELSDKLSLRAEEVASMLLPMGKRVNGSWVAGDINGNEGKSLQIHVEGQHTGRWKDWGDSDEHRGDLVDLWRMVKGLSPKDAIKEIKGFLGISDPIHPYAEKTYSAPVVNVQATPTGKIYQYLTSERNLNGPTIGLFDIRGSKIKDQVFIVFPSMDPSGELVNNSYRSLGLVDGKKKVFQDKGCAPCLFGWQAMRAEDYASRSILLCEGQIDAMTWRQWGIPALSIPNGSGTTWVEYEWENLEIFSTIYLSFDMDGKTSDSLQKVISRLGRHRCLVVKLPRKDANDCLKDGFTAEDASGWVKEASAPTVKDFISAIELKSRVISEFHPDPSKKKGVKVALFNGRTVEDTFEIRPGEVTLWTGIAGHGKSTFLKDIFMDLINHDEKCMIASFEMRPEKIVKTMLKSSFGRETLSVEDISQCIDSFGSQLFFCDIIGHITKKQLLEMMEFAHCRHGVTQFMIDSLMRIDALEENYPEQGAFMNDISVFVKTYDCHVHIVAHPRKTEKDEAPSSNDIKGSTLLRNNADNILIVQRNFKKDKEKAEGTYQEEESELEWDAKVTVEKDREEGYVRVFRYRYYKMFNRYAKLN